MKLQLYRDEIRQLSFPPPLEILFPREISGLHSDFYFFVVLLNFSVLFNPILLDGALYLGRINAQGN